jgi:hypothetical protein
MMRHKAGGATIPRNYVNSVYLFADGVCLAWGQLTVLSGSESG